MAKKLRNFFKISSSVLRWIGLQINYPSGGLPTKCFATSEELITKFSDGPMILALRKISEFSCHNFLIATGQKATCLCCLTFHGPFRPMLQPLDLIPYCNFHNPLTDEEDTTNTKHIDKQPHEHEHAYNAEIKILNIIHTKMHNPSYT